MLSCGQKIDPRDAMPHTHPTISASKYSRFLLRKPPVASSFLLGDCSNPTPDAPLRPHDLLPSSLTPKQLFHAIATSLYLPAAVPCITMRLMDPWFHFLIRGDLSPLEPFHRLDLIFGSQRIGATTTSNRIRAVHESQGRMVSISTSANSTVWYKFVRPEDIYAGRETLPGVAQHVHP